MRERAALGGPGRRARGSAAIRAAVDVELWVVPDLEGLVDRGALLRGEAEPPYWAHLWTGARLLARYVVGWTSLAGARVLEIGCGLGLPGIAAAAMGARVTFVDTAPAAHAFVRASLDANGLDGTLWHADYRALPVDARFDVILAAEVAYDRDGYPALAASLRRHLAPAGRVLMADGFRTDTRPLYRALRAAGLATAAIDCRVVEERGAAPVRLVLGSPHASGAVESPTEPWG